MLKGKSCAVLGLGGLANNVLQHLLAFGCSRLLLVDFDIVEATDLHRQLYYAQDDLGRPKAAALRARIVAQHPGVSVDARVLRLSSRAQIAGLVAGYDFVLRSADSPAEIDEWVNAACLSHRIPFVIAGTMEQKALLGPLVIPFRTACVSCSESLEFAQAVGERQRRSVLHYNRSTPVIAPMVGYLGDLVAEEIMRLFRDPSTCRLTDGFYLLDFVTLKWRRLHTRRRADCPACGAPQAAAPARAPAPLEWVGQA